MWTVKLRASSEYSAFEKVSRRDIRRCRFTSSFRLQVGQYRETKPDAQQRTPVLCEPTEVTEADVHKGETAVEFHRSTRASGLGTTAVEPSVHWCKWTEDNCSGTPRSTGASGLGTTAAEKLPGVLRSGRNDSRTNSATTTLTMPLSLEFMDAARSKEKTSAETGVCMDAVISAAFLFPPNTNPALSSILEQIDAGRTVHVTKTRRQLLWECLPQWIRTAIRRLLCLPEPDKEIHPLGSVFVACVVPNEDVGGHLFKNGLP